MVDCIVIGAGPAGMTAALYLRRAGKSVLVLEKETIGGQIALSPRLENYPSVPSESGEEFASHLFDQITELGADFELEEVKSIEKKDEGDFVVHGDDADYEGKSILIATGCSHRPLGIPGEKELVGKGVSYCAVCDGAFFAGKDVLLIGDANTALQYAIMLSEICNKVTILTLFDKFFADDVLQKKLMSLSNVEIRHNLASKRMEQSGEDVKVFFENTITKQEEVYQAAGVFVAIGQVPHNEPFASYVDLEKGFILTDEAMATKTSGIYAAGDCRKKSVRQVVTATNDGAIAAMGIVSYLNRLD